jgi:hypothetical protein
MSDTSDGTLQYVYNNISMYYCRKDRIFTEECFVQNDNTHFMSNTLFFSRYSRSLRNYENHSTCRQADRDVKWRKRQLCCASQLTETVILILCDNV